ncbi:aminotransferase class III-fold pyridoxal phosphate-dependent enzyme [Ancylobacter sp. A5.8]|uniref:aspartate aminotransferase family protein n=1 Tax=Ancylobacter gelatini TaxID=2919920 RepID=UPI001F4EC088|nr:aminotransferase class III-fold pyridoxal phosphate-dependent enzyme [Ancylobacter gelatini]MCJ8142332.1 aminotransferase class III-fold pyridoxal phosphate-dependent enzyme [Ancylobacter gelatini]
MQSLNTQHASEDAGQLGRHGHLSAKEKQEFDDAARLIPGGVLGGNSFPKGTEFVFSHGAGPRFWDTSGNEYIDYVLGSGAIFTGHAHPRLQQAVTEQVARGTHFFSYLNEGAVELTRRLNAIVPCAERIRLTTSGSESTFHAMRLARAFTGRDKILKFEGAYHGNHDYTQLSTTPKKLANFPTPVADTDGIPEVVRDLMLVAPYNDPDTLASILAEHGKDIAAVIVEPIQRIISPKPGFLQAVRELTTKHGIVMIMDEVVTGFRYGLSGAQGYFGVTPDMATFGKIIGGGLPVGAVTGRADIMDQADPTRKGYATYVYQNGTLQGHPLGCATALATLDILEEPGIYDRTFAMADKLRAGMQKVMDSHDMGLLVFGDGPMWHMLLTEKAPTNWRDIVATDLAKLASIEVELINEGIFILPGNRRFISTVHTDADLDATFAAADRACVAWKKKFAA